MSENEQSNKTAIKMVSFFVVMLVLVALIVYYIDQNSQEKQTNGLKPIPFGADNPQENTIETGNAIEALQDEEVISNESQNNKTVWRYAVSCRSNSMWPQIQCNDIISVAPQSEYHKGDIIHFLVYAMNTTSDLPAGYSWFVHRIIQENPDGSFVTQGDNNVFTDQQLWGFTVTNESIRGKVIRIDRLVNESGNKTWMKIEI